MSLFLKLYKLKVAVLNFIFNIVNIAFKVIVKKKLKKIIFFVLFVFSLDVKKR